MDITCQFSLYPLHVEHLSPTIDTALAAIADHGLSVTAGPLTSTALGPAETVFAALRDASTAAAEHGDGILAATISNACPQPAP